MDFRAALISAYCEHPCQVLPNALWKILREIDAWETTFSSSDGAITHLEARTCDRLYVYWDRAGCPPQLAPGDLDGITFALVHRDFIDAFPAARFSIREAYFRLVHTGGSAARASCPPGFRVQPVDTSREADVVADVIGRCYGDPHFALETVLGWTRHPVFDADLWLWVSG